MTNGDLARLEAEARYHRERLALYRARAYGADTTTPGRLRKLERAAADAEQRLRSVREKSTAQ
ncbi:MAG: hypothetical protein ACRDLQ_05315 [Solirubrobacterales bacterium]